MRKRLVWLVFALMVGGAGPAAAQVAWDSPLLLPPAPPAGFGIYLVEAAGGDLGVMASWRGRGSMFGFRGGIAEQEFTEDIAAFGGIDFSGRLTRASADFPLDVDWVAGLGLGVGDDATLFSVPFGVSLGRRLDAEGATFTPYGTPRLVVDACLDCPGDDDIELDFGLDLGVDIALRQGWAIRFGVVLGDDREALAIGFLF